MLGIMIMLPRSDTGAKEVGKRSLFQNDRRDSSLGSLLAFKKLPISEIETTQISYMTTY